MRGRLVVAIFALLLGRTALAEEPSPSAVQPPPAAAQPPPAADQPSPSAVLYAKRCSSCHSIGDGDRVGPDLLGVTTRRDAAWIKEFVPKPGAKIDGGDPIATELFKKFNTRMPDQDVTPEDVDGLIAYFKDCETKGGCKPTLGAVKNALDATPGEIALGKALFEGTQPLKKGGPACIGCHNVRGAGIVGGGTLARDLTFVYARFGDVGLQASLDTLPFPLMKDVFLRRALTPEESYALKAYFGSVARDGTPPLADQNFLYLGVLGLFVSLGTIGAIWHGRLRGVRQSIVKRGSR